MMTEDEVKDRLGKAASLIARSQEMLASVISICEFHVAVITIGEGSWTKHRGAIVEQPYLDGAQHVAFPTPRKYR